MVINRNPRKAICFWRVRGEQREHQFPDFILRQIWVTWGRLQLGRLRLLWISFPCPLFVFLETSFPFTPLCWDLVVPLLLSPLPSYTPQGAWGAKGWAWGWDQPWASTMRWRRTQPSSISEGKDLLATDTSPKGKGFPCSLLETEPCPPTLLCQTPPSRERLGVPSLAQALTSGQYPLQPRIATQNSLLPSSIEIYFHIMTPYI